MIVPEGAGVGGSGYAHPALSATDARKASLPGFASGRLRIDG